MRVLDQRVDKKKYIFEYYQRELGELDGVGFMTINTWNEPNYWLSVMTLAGKVRPLDIMEALEAENIIKTCLEAYAYAAILCCV